MGILRDLLPALGIIVGFLIGLLLILVEKIEKRPKMKVWLIDRTSDHYTTGKPLIVTAENSKRAAKLVKQFWENYHQDVDASDMQEITTLEEGVYYIDANYV